MQNKTPAPAIERLQSPEDREKRWSLRVHSVCVLFNGVPVFLVESRQVRRSSGLLQAYRFLVDSRDTATEERLAALDDPFSVFRCRGIMNCVSVCPKRVEPNQSDWTYS